MIAVGIADVLNIPHDDSIMQPSGHENADPKPDRSVGNVSQVFQVAKPEQVFGQKNFWLMMSHHNQPEAQPKKKS